MSWCLIRGAGRHGRTPIFSRFPNLALLVGVVLAVLAMPTLAQKTQLADPAGVFDHSIRYSRQGADTCLKCHDSDHIQSIFQTPHGQKGDSRTPFAKMQCETCHGPGGKHARRLMPGQKRPFIFLFGSKSPVPVKKQNAVCLSCHQEQTPAWQGGPHQEAGVACADCHTIHAKRDKVLSKATQPEVCFKCHKSQRAQFQRAFTHPVGDRAAGQLACSDCHQPHKSLNQALLIQPTVNQTCYTCHADKRGPFLWEHPPAAENCTLCHQPHGSNHRYLLSKEPPLLCQDCHSPAGHPSVARTGEGLPNNQPSALILAGSCTNCHTKVHGSNSPSGAELFR